MNYFENGENLNMKSVQHEKTSLLMVFVRSLFLTIMFTGIGVCIGGFLPNSILLIASIIGLIICICVSVMVVSKGKAPMGYAYFFGFVEGLSLTSFINLAIGVLGTHIVIMVIMGLFVYSGILMIKGYTTERSLNSLGGSLFLALIAILIMSIINIFIGGDTLLLIISILSIIVFSLYIVYDMNKLTRDIKKGYIKSKDELTIYVFNMYLDLINLIIHVLRILIVLKSENDD